MIDLILINLNSKKEMTTKQAQEVSFMLRYIDSNLREVLQCPLLNKGKTFQPDIEEDFD